MQSEFNIQWDGKAASGKKMGYEAYTFSLTAAPVNSADGETATAKLTVLTRAAAKTKAVDYSKKWYIPSDKYNVSLTVKNGTSSSTKKFTGEVKSVKS